MSGLSKLQTKKSDYPIMMYNPDLISWMASLLPKKDYTIAGVSSVDIYSTLFSRVTRLLASTYVYLNTDNRFKTELDQLKESWLVVGFDLDSYKEQAYRNILTEVYNEEYSFNPEDAMLFWLKNALRGTINESKRLLSQIIEEYDPDFYKQIDPVFNEDAKTE